MRIPKIFRFLSPKTSVVISKTDDSGNPVGNDLAGGDLCVATVYRCVKLISESVANLSMQVMRRDDTGTFTPRYDSLWYLMNVAPSPGYDAFTFWTIVLRDYLTYGSAYIIPRFDKAKGEWRELTLIYPPCVQHDCEARTYTITDELAGIKNKTFKESEIIHIVDPGRDHRDGLGVLGYAQNAIDIAREGDSETYSRLRDGGTFKGLVSNASGGQGWGTYRSEDLKQLSMNLWRRLRTEHIVEMPGSDVKFQQLMQSNEELQLQQTRAFTVREICRFFGVHPSFVFDDTSNNYKSAEMATSAFLSNTLNPILRKIETELLRKLVLPEYAYFRKFEFDRRGLFASDLAGKVAYYKELIAAGVATVNEVRAMEDMPPVEGGDKLLVSANLRAVDELNQPKQTEQ